MPITPGSLSVAAPIQGLLTPTTLRLRRIDQLAAAPPLELTIVMPCLNEAETLATCIGKAQRFLRIAASAARWSSPTTAAPTARGRSPGGTGARHRRARARLRRALRAGIAPRAAASS